MQLVIFSLLLVIELLYTALYLNIRKISWILNQTTIFNKELIEGVNWRCAISGDFMCLIMIMIMCPVEMEIGRIVIVANRMR